MIRNLPKDFDGSVIKERFELSNDDFYASGDKLYINSEKKITQKDIDSCIVDVEKLENKREMPILGRIELEKLLTLDYLDIDKYVENEIIDLDSSKTLFKLILSILVSMKNIIGDK